MESSITLDDLRSLLQPIRDTLGSLDSRLTKMEASRSRTSSRDHTPDATPRIVLNEPPTKSESDQRGSKHLDNTLLIGVESDDERYTPPINPRRQSSFVQNTANLQSASSNFVNQPAYQVPMPDFRTSSCRVLVLEQ